jgi:hypothetical protein
MTKPLKSSLVRVSIDKFEPYAKIYGDGEKRYIVKVYSTPGTFADYVWDFRSLARAEKWAKKKLDKAKRVAEHERYIKLVTIKE